MPPHTLPDNWALVAKPSTTATSDHGAIFWTPAPLPSCTSKGKQYYQRLAHIVGRFQ